MTNKLITLLLILCVFPSAALAQKNALKALERAGEKAAVQTERRMVHYPATAVGVSRTVPQSKKALYWTQTRVLRISPKQALKNLEKIGVGPTIRGARPALESHSFAAENLKNYTMPAPSVAQAPAFPFPHSTTLIFRGLALSSDGVDIANILQNGLRISDVGGESNTLLRSYAGAAGGGAVRAVNAPVTNLTSNPQEAAAWARRRMKNDYLAVVVAVKSQRRDNLIMIFHDIPASDIHSVNVLLNLNGTLKWCKVQLNALGGFTLTPYANAGVILAQ